MGVLTTKKNKGGNRRLFDFTNGIDVDKALAAEEIQVQKAWARALSQIAILQPAEAETLQVTLEQALEQMQRGEFQWKVEDEDIHMNLERFLVEKLGELGKRIHLGRSRNDLIATTLRLFVCHSLAEAKMGLETLIQSLCTLAAANIEKLVPGMTHLQHGQPVRFAHVLCAHGEAFARDYLRLEEAQKQAMAVMPLGSAALAGTTLPLDLTSLATELGFMSAPLNSYDAVGDRDFLLNALNAIALIGIHLGRLSEDFIIWSSTPVGLVKLPKDWSTGSSIMPNKRNPDVPELVRAKSAHLIGAQVNGMALMKGLPTSYNSDLHELKGVFLHALGELDKCLQILPPFILGLEVNKVRAQELLGQGHLLATEIANHLALIGVNFREAYQITAALVAAAEEDGVSVEKLDSGKVQKICPHLSEKFMTGLDACAAIESRKMPGGTAREQVLLSLTRLKDLGKRGNNE